MDVAILIHDQISGGDQTSTLDETGVEIIQLLSAHTTNEVAVDKVGELQQRLENGLRRRSGLMPTSHEPLSDNELQQFCPRCSPDRIASGGRARPHTEAPRSAPSFETPLPYVNMKVQRDFAALLQIQDPYYRLHEARAGAATILSGQPVSNFASYDYLGLNGHPEILEAGGGDAGVRDVRLREPDQRRRTARSSRPRGGARAEL